MADWRDDYDGERYSEPLRLVLMPSQMAQLKAEAKERGISNFSAYARAKLVGEQVPACDVRVLRQLVYEINSIGNNFNQFVKLAHESGRVRLTEDLEAIREQLKAALERVIEL